MPPKYFGNESSGDLLPVAIVPTDVAQQLPNRERASFGELSKAYFDTQSMLGSLTESAAARAAVWMQDEDPTYNAYGDIQLAGTPKEEIDAFYSGSRSAGETAIIQERIRKERENREIIASEGLTARSIGAAVVSQGLDVAALWLSGGASGAMTAETALGAAAKGAAAAAVAETGAEAVKQVTQYERTWTESAMNVAGAAFFGGAIPAATTSIRNVMARNQKQLAEQIAQDAARVAGAPDPASMTAATDLGDAAIVRGPYTVKSATGKGPISFIGEYLSPNGQAERLPEPVARELRQWVSTSKVSGANVAGEAVAPVESRLLGWDNEFNGFVRESANGYRAYLKEMELGIVERIKAGFGAQPRPNVMSESQWDDYVGRIIQDGADETIPSKFGYTPDPRALAAAKKGRALLDRAGRELYETGLFTEPPEPNYFTHFWKAREISRSQIEFKTDLIADLPKMLERDGKNLGDYTKADLDELAEDIIDTISAKHGNLQDGFRANVGVLKGRVLKFDNQDAVCRKWCVQSASEVLDRYQRAVAPQIEGARNAVVSAGTSKIRQTISALESGEHIRKAVAKLTEKQAAAAEGRAGKMAAKALKIEELEAASKAELDAAIADAMKFGEGTDAATVTALIQEAQDMAARRGGRISARAETLAKMSADDLAVGADDAAKVEGLIQRMRAATDEKLDALGDALAVSRKRDAKAAAAGLQGRERIEAYYRAERAKLTDSKARAKLDKQMENAIYAHDGAVRMLNGGFTDMKDVSGISAWVPRAMKWNILTKMGRVSLSQFNDVGTLPLRYGIGNTLSGFRDRIAGLADPAWRQNTEMVGVFADALDTITSSRMLSIAEMDQSYLRKTGSDIAIDWMYRRAGTFSGFNLWSEEFKGFSGQLASSMIWRRATGKVDDAALPGLLESVGLSAGDLSELGKRAWMERGKSAVPDFAKWADDDLTRKFGIAVRQLVKATTNEPTVAMKPYWTRTVYGRMATQFKGFYFGFYEHTLGFMEQKWKLGTPMQKASVAATTTGFVGLGAASHWLREKSYGREPDIQSGEFWINAVDQSGLFTLFMEPNNILETATGSKVGIRPMMGIESPSGRYRNVNKTGALLGPTGGLAEDVIQTGLYGIGSLAGQPLPADFYRRAAKILPYNNALLFAGLYDVTDKTGEITGFYDLPDEPRKEIPEMLGEKKSRRRKASGL